MIREHRPACPKPGRRVYSAVGKVLPHVRNGLGITIVSTPKGVCPDARPATQTSAAKSSAEVF